jgi:hypothetical protein
MIVGGFFAGNVLEDQKPLSRNGATKCFKDKWIGFRFKNVASLRRCVINTVYATRNEKAGYR